MNACSIPNRYLVVGWVPTSRCHSKWLTRSRGISRHLECEPIDTERRIYEGVNKALFGSDNGLSEPMMAYCLLAIGKKSRWNLSQNKLIVIQENAFENVVCKTAAILSRARWVKRESRPFVHYASSPVEVQPQVTTAWAKTRTDRTVHRSWGNQAMFSCTNKYILTNQTFTYDAFIVIDQESSLSLF